MDAALEVTSPFPPHAWPQVWRWIESYRDRALADEAPQTREEFVLRAEQMVCATYAVSRGGELGGLIIVQPVSDAARRIQIFFKRALWGTGTAQPAVRLVLEQIFADPAIEKVTSMPFEDNHGMRSFLARLGFEVEGTMRRQTRRGGQLVGLTIFSLFREKFECHSE